MKVAVYAVTKNEVFSAKRFMESIKRAGLPVYVLDHSDDGTTDILSSMGAIVSTEPITPWRFDHGKNAALDLVPKDFDFVINLDLDEELTDVVKDALSLIDKNTTRVCHLYKPDANTDRVREELRIHTRNGYRWRWPIHEELYTNGTETIQFVDDVLIQQWPNKKRSHTWSPQLLSAVAQYPNSPRMRLFCGRDLFFDGRFKEALDHLNIFVRMKAAFNPDKSYAHSLIAKCLKALGDDPLPALQKAAKVGRRRESLVELAHHHMLKQEYRDALGYASDALTIQNGRFAANNDPGAWTFKPHEIIMICAYNLYDVQAAISAGHLALQYAAEYGDKQRISANLAQMGAAS